MLRHPLIRDILLVAGILLLVALAAYVAVDAYHWGKSDSKTGGASAQHAGVNVEKRRKPEEMEIEGRKPEVRLFADRAEYADWYREHSIEPQVELLSPEGVDFRIYQVLVVTWGDKPREGHEIKLKEIERGESETIVTVTTTTPPDDATPIIVFPGFTTLVPREKPVRVIITGDRMRPVPKFFDFTPSRTANLEVEVSQK